MIEWVHHLARRRYRELDRFDTGHQERAARALTRPSGNVERAMAADSTASLRRAQDFVWTLAMIDDALGGGDGRA